MDMLANESRNERRNAEHTFIVARQPFQSYLRFVRSKHVGPVPAEKLLEQEWREIQRRAMQADEQEAGIADGPEMLPLPDDMIPIAQEARQQESIERTFGMRSCQWWLVEIDRAIVFQPWVDLTFTRELEASMPRPLSHEDHIRLATGTLVTKPLITSSQPADDRFAFFSPSTDVRFLGASLLDPAAVKIPQPRGITTHVVAVFLGMSVNCLAAAHVKGRLILLNGTHRAYTLRAMGFTHIACLVTHVTNDEEKAQILPASVQQEEARYLSSRRPPLFKDYFDPALRRIVPTIPTQTLLKLRLKQSKEIVPAG